MDQGQGQDPSATAIHRLRLGSGLVLLTYISMHMLNHALGIVSLTLADAALQWSIHLWQSWPGTVALYGAFALHLTLALRTIHQRRHWRLPLTEWIRLWAGFSLPLLLITHVVSTRVATSFYGFEPTYQKVVTSIINGEREGWQVALLAPGWIHGCLGLWIGLRHHPRIQRARAPLAIAMVAVPLLAVCGFLRMTVTVEASAAFVARPPVAVSPYADALAAWRQGLQVGYVTLVLGSVATGWLRRVVSPGR
jgi:adenylate cyclase